MKKLYYCVLLFLFSTQSHSNPGFLCDMFINDVTSTQEYEQALADLKEVETSLAEIQGIRAEIAAGRSLEEINPDVYALKDIVIKTLEEEEKAQGRQANLTIALDAGALTFAYLLWRSYRARPEALSTIVTDATKKNFNGKVYLIPSLIAAVAVTLVGSGSLRALMAKRKERINTLREQLEILAKAQIQGEFITYLEDIIEDNYSTLRLERSRLVGLKCLKGFEFEDGQNYCEEHPDLVKDNDGVDDFSKYDKCW